MRQLIIPFLLGLIAGLSQITIVEALPSPVRLIELTALVAVVFIIRFKPVEAFVATLAGAFVYDLLQPSFFGARLILLAGAVLVLNLLFTRIFTNVTLPSLVSLTLAGYVLFRGVHALAAWATTALSGLESSGASIWARLGLFLAAAALQTVLALLLMLISSRRKIFGHANPT